MSNQLEVELTDEQLEQMLAERKAKKVAEEQEKRNAYETLKEQTIEELVTEALAVQQRLIEFKEKSFDSMKTQYDLLKEYSNRSEDGKGNFRLVSKDGMKKIEFSRQDSGFFDERSEQAEKHIKEFVTKQFGSDEATKDLITSLLERKRGHLDIKMIQKLYSMEDRFDDENWRNGIKLLKESWQTGNTKFYINYYTKNTDDAWEHVNINFASV